MSDLIVLIGPPCSGKTTWSNEYIRNRPSTVRFNRVDIARMMRVAKAGNLKIEEIITSMIVEGIEHALDYGMNVIIDHSNCKFSLLSYYNRNFANIADIKYKVFDEPMEVLKKRNQMRAFEHHVEPIPDRIIEKMHGWQQSLLELPDFKKMLERNEIK